MHNLIPVSLRVIAGEPMIPQVRIITPCLRRPLKLTLTLFIDLHIGVIFPIGFLMRKHFCAISNNATIQVP
jgi:hypothetical protein